MCGRGKGQMGSECAWQWRGTLHAWVVERDCCGAEEGPGGAERGRAGASGRYRYMAWVAVRGSSGAEEGPGGAERGLRDTSRGIPRYMDLQAVDGYRYTRLIYKRLLDTAWSQNVAERETWVLTVPV